MPIRRIIKRFLGYTTHTKVKNLPDPTAPEYDSEQLKYLKPDILVEPEILQDATLVEFPFLEETKYKNFHIATTLQQRDSPLEGLRNEKRQQTDPFISKYKRNFIYVDQFGDIKNPINSIILEIVEITESSEKYMEIIDIITRYVLTIENNFYLTYGEIAVLVFNIKLFLEKYIDDVDNEQNYQVLFKYILRFFGINKTIITDLSTKLHDYIVLKRSSIKDLFLLFLILVLLYTPLNYSSKYNTLSLFTSNDGIMFFREYLLLYSFFTHDVFKQDFLKNSIENLLGISEKKQGGNKKLLKKYK